MHQKEHTETYQIRFDTQEVFLNLKRQFICIVDWVVIAAQCTVTFFLKTYCAPPNLGITRTD